MPFNFQPSPAEVLSNGIVSDLQAEWILTLGAEMEIFQPKSLNEALRSSICWKPGGPHLNRHSLGMPGTTTSPWIHQQVAEPPCAGAIR